jgi:hypothetical protein
MAVLLLRTSPDTVRQADTYGTALGGEDHRATPLRGIHMSVVLTVLESVFQKAAALSAATGLAYTGGVVAVAVSSVAFRNPQRRRDARATLALLTRRTEQARRK